MCRLEIVRSQNLVREMCLNLRELQSKDRRIEDWKRREGELVRSFKKIEEVWYKRTGKRMKIVVPEQYESHLIDYVHQEYGHCGVDKTKDLVEEDFFIQNCRRKVREYVKRCDL